MDHKGDRKPSILGKIVKYSVENADKLALLGITGLCFYYRNTVLKKWAGKDFSSVPESCPGPDTENAGRSASCEGCPNKSVCSSRNPSIEAESIKVNNSLKEVDKIIIVASGKGGVGKSTVATQLAFSLDQLGKKVGLLDIDITGPSIPAMTGTTDSEVFESLLGWTPVYVTENMSVMSIGYLMNDSERCISWRGAKKDALIKKFLTNVNWGELDYLVVDTPPGTSDEHITLVNTIKIIVNDGDDSGMNRVQSVLVTTPQRRAIDDVRRTAQFCNDLGIQIILLVENMTNSFLDSFRESNAESTRGSGEGNSKIIEELCDKFKIRHHLKVDSDPAITEAGECGYSLLDQSPFTKIATYVIDYNSQPPTP